MAHVDIRDEVLEALRTLQDDSQNTCYYCLASFFTIAAALYSFRFFFLKVVVPQTKNTENKIDDFVVEAVQKWVEPIMVVSTSAWLATSLFPINEAVDHIAKFMFMSILCWRIIRLIEMTLVFLIENYVVPGEGVDAKNLRSNFFTIIRTFLYSFAIVFILDNVGFNASSLVASMGIGGIAIALAVQNIIADTFASFCIFVDRPFVVGDLISVNGFTGFIEHIGFKTTRVRSLGGETVVYTNSTLINSTLQNFKEAEVTNLCFEIGVDVNTSNEVVREIPQVMEHVFKDIKRAKLALVFFKSFGKCTLNFEVRYQVLSNDADVCRQVLGEINVGFVFYFLFFSLLSLSLFLLY
jgi:small-conductance mechanosensitive channel